MQIDDPNTMTLRSKTKIQKRAPRPPTPIQISQTVQMVNQQQNLSTKLLNYDLEDRNKLAEQNLQDDILNYDLEDRPLDEKLRNMANDE